MTNGTTDAVAGLLGTVIVLDVASRVLTKKSIFSQPKAQPRVRTMPKTYPKTYRTSSRSPKWI